MRARGRSTTGNLVALPARAARDDVHAAALVVAASVAAGLVLGFLWRLAAPQAELQKRATGVFAVGADSETSIAADGWFAVLGLAAGVLAALLVATLLRRGRLGALLGLTLGGLLGAVVAWRFGVLLGPDSVSDSADAARVGDRFSGPLELQAIGVLLAWPIAAVIAYFAAVAGVEPAPAAGEVAEPASGAAHAPTRPPAPPTF